MYQRLLDDPASYRSAPSTRGSVLSAAFVVLVAMAAVLALVWASTHATGPVEWFLVGLGWACVFVARPVLLDSPPTLSFSMLLRPLVSISS